MWSKIYRFGLLIWSFLIIAPFALHFASNPFKIPKNITMNLHSHFFQQFLFKSIIATNENRMAECMALK